MSRSTDVRAQLPAAVASALTAVARGDVAGALATVPEGPYRVALLAHAHLADPRVALPTWAEVEALAAATEAGRHAAALACEALGRARRLCFDAGGFAAVLARHATFVGSDSPPQVRIAYELAHGWSRVLGGAGARTLASDADRVRQEAGAAGQAALVVEAMVVRALAALGAGDLEEARATARRAARMAQTEALPQAEYLAHVVLARVRRVLGRPHLATRILEALARTASAVWRPWIEWERAFAMAGGLVGEAVSSDPAGALAVAQRAAARGDRVEFDAARARAERALAGFRDFDAEARALFDALDATREPGVCRPELAPWLRGDVAFPPFGVHGAVLGGERDAGERAPVYVVAGPGRPPRRFLRPGLALVDREGAALRLAETHRKQGRLDTAVAALALAGPAGVTDVAFFQSVYGFAFVPELHRGALEVLLHRVRERLGEGGTLRRGQGGHLHLDVHTLLVVPDPRCTPGVDDRILRLLATQQAATARQTAEALGVPLRTVQSALAEMVDEGVLRIEGKGRAVAYAVEDTVFSEPTTGTSRNP